MPLGSSEAAWSEPHIDRSSVICRSTTQAPNATAAEDEGMPVSCPEYPTGTPNCCLSTGMTRRFSSS